MNSVILTSARKRQLNPSRFFQHPKRDRFVLLAVFLVAVLVRLAPLLWESALSGDSGEYDDGVYFAAAQHLVAGQVPYRDFVLLHPPGIALALAPFAALGHFIGDANAYAAAKLLVIMVGAVNATLVAWIAGRQGTIAGAAGGLLYAVWWTVASSEITTFLEPFLNLLLLLAVGLLTRQGPAPRRTVIAGILMGACVGFKIWPVPVLLMLVGWLFWTSGSRAAWRFIGGCGLSLAAIFGPFLIFAPHQMWNELVIDQLVRQGLPSDPEQSIADRLLPFAGFSDHLDHVVPVVFAYLMAAAVVAGLILLVRNVPYGRLWCAIFCIQIAELLLADNFYATHYPAYAAGSLAVLIGFAAARAQELLDRGRRPGARHSSRHSVTNARAFAGALAIVLLAVLFISSMAIGMKRAKDGAVDNSALSSFAQKYRCVFASSTVEIIADQETRNIAHGCDFQIDFVGVFLDNYRAHGAVGEVLTQLEIQAELTRSQAVVLNSWYQNYQSWSVATQKVFLSRFKFIGHMGLLQLWSEKG